VRIGIVGGSGDFGQGVAGRLLAHGHDVVIGSRTPRDDFVSNAECCERSDVVFLSIPAESVRPITRELSRHLAAKVVVSVATSVVFRDGHPTADPGRTSLAELTQREAADARVVAALHTVSARLLARLDHELDEDTLYCGGDEEAKAVVADLCSQLVAGRAVDAGPLESARWLETLTAVLLNVNRRYRKNTGIRITGLE
jgi:8-hydroxy-5-deazaflavin:NADPH oxidoreductase